MANTKAAQAMRYMRSAGVSLKAAWAHVKGKRGGGDKKKGRSTPKKSSGGHHTAKKKGLFGLGLPKVGDMVQGAYYANQLGGFAALDMLTSQDPSYAGMDMNARLTAAGNHVVGKVTSVGNIIGTIITGTILNIGLKMARKIGGKYTRGWL